MGVNSHVTVCGIAVWYFD